MTTPFIGQIQPLAFGFAPRGWAQCNGQILSISQNSALFALLGTTFGGNGTTTFALPNLQSRVPMNQGTFSGDSFFMGEMAGTENVTINISDMPGHGHTFSGSAVTADRATPIAGAALANFGGTGTSLFYAADTTPQPINPASVSSVGGNLPHPNIQPYLVINWCIALTGIFPARN